MHYQNQRRKKGLKSSSSSSLFSPKYCWTKTLILLYDDNNSRTHLFTTQIFYAGSKFGYHGVTYGLYADVLVEKVDPKGRSVKQVFLDDIAKPYGNNVT